VLQMKYRTALARRADGGPLARFTGAAWRGCDALLWRSDRVDAAQPSRRWGSCCGP